MIDLAVGFLACGKKLPAGKRMGVCTSSGGAGVWMADACVRAGLDVPMLDDATRKAIDVHLPSYGTSQNPVDSTAQGVHKLGYAEFARLVGQSPLVDGVIVVVTARRSAFLENDLPKLQALGRDSKKPVFMWTYTLPSDRSVEILNEAGYPLFTGALGCARTMRAMADYRRAADKALKACKPLIVAKIGQTEPGRRAVASHTAALAGSHAAYRAIFQHHGVIEGRDFDEMIDLAVGFLACGKKLPAGKRMGVCTSSGGAGVWMADACVRAGLEVPMLDDATRKAVDVHLPSYGTSQNPVDSTAQGVHKHGYAEFARLVGQSPLVDGLMVVVTARRSAFLENALPKLQAL